MSASLESPELSLSSSSDGFTNIVNSRLLKRQAIASYAVICHTLIDGDIYYLIGRVRDTIPFKEFIHGHVKPGEAMRFVQHLSKEEQYRLLHEDFDELIDEVVVNHKSKSYRNLKECKERFETVRNEHKQLLSKPSLCLKEAPWIFPKGRKQDVVEDERTCALREFEEETHIPASLVTLYDNIDPLEEIYTGLDNHLYKTVYFVGFIEYEKFIQISGDARKKFIVTKKRTTISDEIAKIKWLPYERAVNKLDSVKQYILRAVNTSLIFTLDRPRLTYRHSF